MSIARIIRPGDCPELAWKNGGGTTREIAVFPPGAGMDDFLWRLSMARVESPGPFSAFDGVDRVLTVLDGRLGLRGPDFAVDLDAGSPPFAFDGGAAVTGNPLGGAVTDLNAMARRGRCRVNVRHIRAGDVLACTDAAFLFALEPQPLGGETLDRWDCAAIAATVTATGDALGISVTMGG